MQLAKREYPAGASWTVACRKSNKNALPPLSDSALAPRFRIARKWAPYVRLLIPYRRWGIDALVGAYADIVEMDESNLTS